MNNQKGFTLIELVVVIVILGILSAVAVPKFVDMSAEAEISAVEGARGAVKSAAALAHAKDLATGSTGSVDIEGTTYTLVNGYPSSEDIDLLAGIDSDFDIEDDAENSEVTISKGDASFTYGEATTDNPTPSISEVN